MEMLTDDIEGEKNNNGSTNVKGQEDEECPFQVHFCKTKLDRTDCTPFQKNAFEMFFLLDAHQSCINLIELKTVISLNIIIIIYYLIL